MQYAAVPRNTRMPDREGHIQTPRDGAHAHTEDYASRYKHTWGIHPEETQGHGHANGDTHTPLYRHKESTDNCTFRNEEAQT